MNYRKSKTLAGASLLVIASTFAAHAQTAAPPAPAQAQNTEAGGQVEEVVVTGTLLRGVAPVGSNVLSISSQDIQASGITNAIDLLNATVPQSNDFMQVEQVNRGSSLGGTRSPIVKPELRDLGDSDTESGAPTLVMIDGHRIVPQGILQSAVDIGIIPPGLIDHQEIVLDGTSAVYGSDAVAGTINYITKKRFDGEEVNIQGGFASGDYWQVSADLTAAHKWDTGGIAVSYSYAKNSDLFDGDRGYTLQRNYLVAGDPYTGVACPTYSTVTAGTTVVNTPSLTGPAVPCPNNNYASLVSSQVRNSGFLTLSQDFGDRVKLDVDAFYSDREIDQPFGPFMSSVNIGPTNPYYEAIPGVAGTPTETVSFSWGPVFGNEGSYNKNSLKVGQVSPTVTVDLGHDWQSRSMVTWGKSDLNYDQYTLDSTRVSPLAAGTTTATAIDPYNIASSSSSLFPGLDYDNHSEGIQTLLELREIADGPLFAFPGGDLRAAIGAEFMRTTMEANNTNSTSHLVTPFLSTSQDDTSVFGELNAPLIGPHNAMAGAQSLNVSFSGRYDHYNDFGGTFNPKIAATYEPVDWLKARGNWGTSFRAPNVADKLGAVTDQFVCAGANANGCTNFPATPLPGQTLSTTEPNIVFGITGTAPNLQPETSKNWSAGLDVKPPMVQGLTISPTFWNIDFKNAITGPPTQASTAFSEGLANLVTVNPTAAQINALAATVPNGQTLATFAENAGYNVLFLYDGRTRNLSRRNLNGVDLSIHYTHPTSFGSVDATFNGAWTLKDVIALSPTAAFTDFIATGTPLFKMTQTVGANVGDFRAQVVWEHESGYAVLASATQCTCQSGIGAFDLVNVSFRYNLHGSNEWTKDTILTLTINNILNNSPPIDYTTAGGPGNLESTIGRLVELGINKKF